MAGDLERLNLLLTLGRYADGEKAARDAIGREPEWGPGYTFLAIFLGNLGRGGEALEPARVGVAKESADPWAHATLARTHLRVGSPKRAVAAAEEALRLDPTYAYARSVLAQAFCIRKRFQDAHAAAVEGLRHSPEDEDLLRWKGWAEYGRSRIAEARATAETGLRLHPRSDSLFNLLGCTLQHQGEHQYVWAVARWYRLHQQAEEAFREAVRLDPACANYQENREDNALVFRRRLLQAGLHAGFLALVLVAGGLMCAGAGPAGLAVAVLAVWGYIGGLFLSAATPGWMLLAAPLGWLDGVRLPPSPALRAARRDWLIKVGAGVLLAAVFVLLMLAAARKP